jgi:hypothetical protein
VPLPAIVLGTAVAQHRLAPAAFAFGLALSFTAVGIFVAAIGFALAIDGGVFRSAWRRARDKTCVDCAMEVPMTQSGSIPASCKAW